MQEIVYKVNKVLKFKMFRVFYIWYDFGILSKIRYLMKKRYEDVKMIYNQIKLKIIL